MCGIAGELRFKACPSGADWSKISHLMQRRGPDDKGEWQDEHCQLIFRRLSILDLSIAGHQPMVSHDGRYVLVFNGEVYNFKLLRSELEHQGVKFKSNSDSEVVLYSLIEWGRDALNRFNGMFALGFYDRLAGKLLLARDHAGIKPLYYLQHTDGLMFGSQYNQLLSHPWSNNLVFSPEASSLYLHLASVPAPYGILQNTFMLDAGSWLEVDAKGCIEKAKYYHFPCYEEPSLFGREALEAVDWAVSAAVKRQLVSDVPVGAFLSGGVDSPLICGKMKQASAVGLKAFTIGMAGDEVDESADAIRYAKELSIEHIVKHVLPDDAIDMLDDVIEACGGPFGDFSIFPTMQVCKLASEDFTVMLSGDGGDELFWGYSNRFGELMDSAADFRHSMSRRRISRRIRRVLGLPVKQSHYHESLGDWQLAKQSRILDSTLKDIFPEGLSWPAAYDLYDFKGYEADESARWLRQNEFSGHLAGVLQKVDHASMYHSLEVRVPLLDREVIEIAGKISWRDCFDLETRTGKLPLRKSLAKQVKSQSTAKKGFEPPMGKWLRTSLRPVVEDVLLSKKSLLGMPINQKALKQYYQLHLDGKANGWGFWPLLSLALWEKRYFG